MNRHAQILRKLLMIVNTVISLPASVITTCEPVVSTTFVLVLTIAVVILPWQRRGNYSAKGHGGVSSLK